MTKPPLPPRKPTAASGFPRANTVRLKSAKDRSPASQRWLERQLNDPYVKAAIAQGWRSRAAFKLIDLDDKFGLIKPHARVIDLGAAPGGWSQVAIRRGAAKVVGIDLLDINPVEGAAFIKGDFNDPSVEDILHQMIGGKAELVLSDMAPNTTGHHATDHIRIIALAELALDFAARTLTPGGGFVAKVFQGGSEAQMLTPMKRMFTTVRHGKPPASRKDSSELYVVATGFKGRQE